MIYLNTGRQTAPRYTKYPFKLLATLSTGVQNLPINTVSGLNIQLPKAYKGLHISDAAIVDTFSIMLYIVDVKNTLKLSVCVYVGRFSAPILDSAYMSYRGSVLYTDAFYSTFRQAAKIAGGAVKFKPSAFPISYACVSIQPVLGIQNITLNGNSIDTILTSGNILAQLDGVLNMYLYTLQGPNVLSVLADLTVLSKVNGLDVSGKYIVVKHTALSDLRVVTLDKIKLIGVADE